MKLPLFAILAAVFFAIATGCTTTPAASKSALPYAWSKAQWNTLPPDRQAAAQARWDAMPEPRRAVFRRIAALEKDRDVNAFKTDISRFRSEGAQAISTLERNNYAGPFNAGSPGDAK